MRQIPLSAEDAAKAKAGKAFKSQDDSRFWYVPSLYAIMILGVFLVGLFLVPAARGEEISNAMIKQMGIVFGVTTCGALLVAWLVWWIFRRIDTVANVVFCVILLAGGVWMVGMTAEQRANAESQFHSATDGRFFTVSNHAHRLLD